MSVAIALLIMSVVMVVAGLYCMHRGWRQARSEKIALSLRREHGLISRERHRGSPWQRSLLQAGIRLPVQLVGGLGAMLAAVFLWLLLAWGFLPAILLMGFSLALGYGLLRWRYHQRLQRMVHQLPGILEHMIRSLKSGRILVDAMIYAMARAPSPLHGALAQARRSIELGVSPGEALEEIAELYDREEFHILAMGVKINQRYGGNASDMLGKLAALIRDREKGQRQLRAMTGETRISAIVLAVLPLALAGYIFMSSPEFLLGLWLEPSGRILLLISLGLQLLGCLLLWRMLRSI